MHGHLSYPPETPNQPIYHHYSYIQVNEYGNNNFFLVLFLKLFSVSSTDTLLKWIFKV